MKKRIKIILKQVMTGILCAGLLICPVFSLKVNGAEEPNGLYSMGAVLMDAESGRVLFSKNKDEVYAMASTTKIMTCILALELGSLDQIVTFSSNAAKQPDVQMNARAGEQYYMKDLLYSLMLESHNDTAVAIAEAIAGDVKNFTDLMDKKAEAIGCTKTNFVTPNGLDGTDGRGDHCTTAEELAMILRYCVTISSKADEFIAITSAPVHEFQEINGKRYVSCNNHNALLTSYEGAYTGKTGFTGKAGYCYVGAAKQDEKSMIITLLGSGWYPHKSYKWKDAKKLLNYGFENFTYQEIGKDSWSFPEIPVVDGMESSVLAETNAGVFTYLLGKEETANCRVEYAKELKAPFSKETVIGTITYEMNGTIIEQFQIYTMEGVEESTFWNHLRKWWKEIQDFVGKMVNNT